MRLNTMIARLIMATALVVLLGGTALAKEIVVMNGTDFEIHAIALSPSESDNWGEDLLGDDVLKPGEGLKINISGDANNWDLAAQDGEGNQVTFQKLDFRSASKVTLKSDATADIE